MAALAAVTLAGRPAAAAPTGMLTVDSFAAKVYKSPKGGKLLYRQLDPAGLDKAPRTRRYPLVLYLHGSGGRGADNKRQLTDAGFCPNLLNTVKFAANYPCFMIAPQVPGSKRWAEVHRRPGAHAMPRQPGDQMRMTLELVDWFIKANPIDANRIYVTGLSMGGFGTWDAIQRRPGLFAAAVPVCGGGDTAQAPKLTGLPLWVWHGDSDRVVKTQHSRDMVAAITKAGGKPKYTEQPNTGHNVWVAAYASAAVWTWMFAQTKGAAAPKQASAPWVVYDGYAGPGKGKHVVLVSGDEEYRSEEALPQLGKILAKRHGFKCTVLFAIDPETGEIDPNTNSNIPGLGALASADVMIIATRFRDLPDAQMKHIADYLAAGKPIIGMRTATHAFKVAPGKTYSKWTYNSKEWPGGFGRQVLGDTWVSHHGRHGRQSTRGVIVPHEKTHPIVRGCDDIWGPTDVYTVRLPMQTGCRPLVYGQVLTGMKPTDTALTGKKNNPMMPVAWTRTYEITPGRKGKVFTTTMGSSTDLSSVGVRRMLVNATYWAAGLESKVTGKANVDLVGAYKPTNFGFGRFKKGVRPADHEMK